ncbi:MULTISPECIES: BamA/TamA family outer membrane protein [Sphingobacterium]|uniref:BamA/TamA family outer membrane protein n=1 Tax=Sphingobacterium populi TaxID=1812824 RepID=A0ABW5UER6_9SPHI|nr:BamA/TamA family outer membrane protein [Sphingobacterium sp. CFCC 11742]
MFVYNRILVFVTFLVLSQSAYAQADSISTLQDTVFTISRSDTIRGDQDAYDIVDAYRSIFPRKDTTDVPKRRSGVAYLPNVNYNPSIGAQIGVKMVAGHVFGDRENTTMSTFATALSATTRGIIVGYLNHDIYTNENKWNLKGSINIARMVGLDYGLGIGRPLPNPTPDELILNNPERNRFTYNYNVYNFSERLYKKLLPGMFVGAGVFFELKRGISVNNEEDISPNRIYSEWNDFDDTRNNNNGLMLNFQYMTRDNPNNAYKGIYADVVLRSNQTWMGSRHSALQLVTDFRKYWNLSRNESNHVLAFWSLGSFKLGNDYLPYLDLPGTGKDAYARSGRGYTFGYFKGLSFYYTELEYRFPIMDNRFLSGVVFANAQTANDQMGTKLFRYWQPAGGAGLRVLFNKTTRTNLCIDYAVGRFGQRGFFLGLNEAF